jgi:serpin B
MLPLDRRRFLLGSLAAGAVLSLPRRTRAVTPVINVVPGLNAAGADVYRKLTGQPGNIFLSPLSIGLAFAMLEAGARGETKQEIDKVFGFGDPGVPEGCQTLSRVITTAKDAEISIANRLWAAQGLTMEKDYLDVTSREFGAAVERVDFAKNVEAAKRINGWIGKETRGKIPELIPAAVLNALTRLVLTNAIYFKGTWETQFKKEETTGAAFHRLGGDSAQAKLMHAHRKLAVARLPEVNVARFPYNGGFAMYVALPTAPDGLKALEPKIDGERLAAWTAAAAQAPAVKQHVWLPKWTARFRTSLADVMKSLGMKQAFDKVRADLTGIAPRGREPLFVSDALHEAFVDVNEVGTEAAGATAILVERSSAERDMFRADHPFFYWIRHESTESVLFAGRLVDPTLPA